MVHKFLAECNSHTHSPSRHHHPSKVNITLRCNLKLNVNVYRVPYPVSFQYMVVISDEQ